MSIGQPEPSRYGVLVANSRFPDEPKLSKLKSPDNDVDGLYGILHDDKIGGFTHIEIKRDKSQHEVLRAIQQTLNLAGRNDLVLIFYAGHGKLDRAGHLHLATFDTVNRELETTSVPAKRIWELIQNAATSKTVLMLDCCYSGAIEGALLRGDVGEELNIMSRGRGTFVMTASTDMQTAREEGVGGLGLFTMHVIAGLEGGAADADGDGVVTMNELYNYVHKAVLAEGYQEPMKWDLNVQGELVIAQSGRNPREERRQAIRDRLFALAQDSTISNQFLHKGLGVLDLPFAESRADMAVRYDDLLERLLDPTPNIGQFIEEWYALVAKEEVNAPEPGATALSDQPTEEPPTQIPAPAWKTAMKKFVSKNTVVVIVVLPIIFVAGLTALQWMFTDSDGSSDVQQEQVNNADSQEEVDIARTRQIVSIINDGLLVTDSENPHPITYSPASFTDGQIVSGIDNYFWLIWPTYDDGRPVNKVELRISGLSYKTIVWTGLNENTMTRKDVDPPSAQWLISYSRNTRIVIQRGLGMTDYQLDISPIY